MTIEGTVHKSFILVAIVIASAAYVWTHLKGMPMAYVLGSLAVGFVLSLVISFFPKTSPYLAPVYAAAEGVFLAFLSSLFEAKYPGIVPQAAALTFGIFVSLLAAYQSGWIKATENFKLGVVAATGGIALVYLASLLGNLTGWYHFGFIHEGGLLGIGFSAFVVFIAAMNLVLDFDFIEEGEKFEAPKYMEWYAAFGLLVTLVWLYVEILRLLSKLKDR